MSLNVEILRLLERMKDAESTDEADILHVETEMKRTLPDDFKEFLRVTTRYEDLAGKHYLAIWSADEIISYNKANLVDEFAPGLLLFGSDGGGESFAFDYRNQPPTVVMVPSIGLELKAAIPIADSFSSFIRRLEDPRSLFDRVN